MATTLDVTEMLPTKSGVYRIRNEQNGRVYIGSSINLPRRKKEHFQLLKRNSHTNQFLQNDFNKNPNFVFEILKLCNCADVLQEEQMILNQVSLPGSFIRKHRSISDASKNIGIAKASITAVLNEKRYQAGGFLWVSEIEKICFVRQRYLENKEKELKRKSKQLSLNNPRRKYHGDNT